MKTRPDPDADIVAGMTRQAHDVSALVADRVQSWGDEAAQVAQETAARVADSVSGLADQVSEATAYAGQVARTKVTEAASNASAAGKRAAARVADGMPEKEVRDQFLFGAAALAITAAIGIAAQRRSQRDS